MSAKFIVLEEEGSFKDDVVSILNLSVAITKAELKTRQFQRLLGPLWWVLEPAIMSLSYFFLSTRLNFTTGDNHIFYILTSTIIWRFFSNCQSVALVTYVAYGAVIRQTDFPLIAANITTVFTEFIFFLCGFSVMVFLGAVFGLPIGWSYLALIPLAMILMVVTFGFMVLLSCIGVYFRDLSSVMTLMLQAVFLLSPAIYGIDRIPYANYIQYVNPFFFIFPAFHQVILKNEWPDLGLGALWMVFGLLLTAVSLKIYANIRPNFLRVL